MKASEMNLIEFMAILAKWKKFILRNFLIVCLVVVMITMMLPRFYTAGTTILPPTGDTGGMGVAAALLSNLPISGFGSGTLGAFSQETNLFLAILNSRSLLTAIAEKFELQKLYETPTMEETLKELQNHLRVQVNEDGTVSLSAEARTPWMASQEEVMAAKNLARDLANAMMDELDTANKRIKSDQAHNTRMFIEKRYLQNMVDLHAAEEAFKVFQEKYQAISLPEQTKALITAAADIRAQITAKEIETEFLAKYLGKSHPDYIRSQNELTILRRKYDQFKYGPKGVETGLMQEDNKDIFIPIDQVPDLGLQYARLYRELMLQEKILEFIMPQYEQAKIQEAKDTPTVQVLDRAILPERKSRPKRMIIVAVSGLMALAFSIGMAVVYERWQVMGETQPEKYRAIRRTGENLLRDWRFWRR
jgi:tyrosine-protein kinase Etk/Wzc